MPTTSTPAQTANIVLPKRLFNRQSLDLTRHRHRGKLLSQADSLALGKAQRKTAPHKALADISQRPKSMDALTLYQWSNQGRLSHLLPIRAKRMSVSPFTFFRGMPALMLFDQAWQTQHSGLYQQICGDCHLTNFGGYASPERNLLFGINDFDETILAPFEWDIQRLVASIIIAAETIGLTQEDGLKAIEQLILTYHEGLESHRSLSPLQVWYEKVDATQLLADTQDIRVQKERQADFEKAKKNDVARVLPKLTKKSAKTGLRKFKDIAPLQQAPSKGQPFYQGVEAFFESYRETLKFDRQVLFDRYQLSDVALRVVGVGSVGTVAAVALFEDADREPLILQMKQAKPSILAPLLTQTYPHQGERVVYGQQLMQASSDIFLGYAQLTGEVAGDFYVRQLRDMKYTANLDSMDAEHFNAYIQSCGYALAHAHAKAGNADIIVGYLGKPRGFITVMQDYALQVATRNHQDYEQFMQEIVSGNIETAGNEVL